jgi:hypothetical protein
MKPSPNPLTDAEIRERLDNFARVITAHGLDVAALEEALLKKGVLTAS